MNIIMVNGTFTLQELLAQLYHYKDELNFIFSRQLIDEPVSYFDYINDTDKERMLFVLQEWGIVFVDDNLIRLDTQTYDFFAQKLNVNKIINVADVQDLINTVRDNIQYSRKDERKRFKYIQHIREMFYSVERKIRISIDNLRNNIDDTYKQATELEIKKMELDKLDVKRESIQNIIGQTLILMTEEKEFFNNNGMENRISQLKRKLLDYGWEVSELQNLIIDYLLRVEVQSDKVKKIKKLKLLLDRHVLEVATDIKSSLSAAKGIPLDGMLRKETKIPLDWLKESDEALDIIDSVRKDIKYTFQKKSEIVDIIDSEYLDREPVYNNNIDYESVKDGFLVQNQDLLKYICNYPFNRDMTPDDYLNVYIYICGTYMDELDITDDTDIYDDVKYKIIKPLEK